MASFATEHKNRLDFWKILKRAKISHKNVTGLQMAVLERSRLRQTANGKRQAEMFSLMKNNETFLV